MTDEAPDVPGEPGPDDAPQDAGAASAAPTSPAGGGADGTRWWRTGGGVAVDVRTVHEDVLRDLAVRLRRLLRCEVDVACRDAEWVSCGEWLQPTPSPVVLAQVALPGADGAMALRLHGGFALCAIDRLLGGSGAVAVDRDPTPLEVDLAGDVLSLAVQAVGELLGPELTAAPKVALLTTAPQHLRIGEPTDPVLQVELDIVTDPALGERGALSLCYPERVAAPLLDRVRTEPGAVMAPAAGDPRVPVLLADVEVELVARLQPSWFAADDLRRLRVGDVLGLDHRRDQPVEVAIDGVVALEGSLGRRGRGVAVRIDDWRTDALPATTEEHHP